MNDYKAITDLLCAERARLQKRLEHLDSALAALTALAASDSPPPAPPAPPPAAPPAAPVDPSPAIATHTVPGTGHRAQNRSSDERIFACQYPGCGAVFDTRQKLSGHQGGTGHRSPEDAARVEAQREAVVVTGDDRTAADTLRLLNALAERDVTAVKANGFVPSGVRHPVDHNAVRLAAYDDIDPEILS